MRGGVQVTIELEVKKHIGEQITVQHFDGSKNNGKLIGMPHSYEDRVDYPIIDSHGMEGVIAAPYPHSFFAGDRQLVVKKWNVNI